MNYYLKNPNEKTEYTRKDWLELSEQDLLNQAEEPSEIYLGDMCFWMPDPASFLSQLYQEVEEDCVLYIEGPEIYEAMAAVFCQSISLEDFSAKVFDGKYLRFVDLVHCRKYIEDAGFEVLHEDIDNHRLCMSFQKPFKKSTN